MAFIDMYDNHPSGFWDTELDCPCDRFGVPCRDCEAEPFNEDPDEYPHEVAS